MKTTLENIGGFDVLYVDGTYTLDEACSLVEKVQGKSGIEDWVLPDRMTLVSLASLANNVDERNWSSSPYVGDSSYAWGVSFDGGYIYRLNRNYSVRVRLVRVSQREGVCFVAAKRSMSEADNWRRNETTN